MANRDRGRSCGDLNARDAAELIAQLVAQSFAQVEIVFAPAGIFKRQHRDAVRHQRAVCLPVVCLLHRRPDQQEQPGGTRDEQQYRASDTHCAAPAADLGALNTAGCNVECPGQEHRDREADDKNDY